MKNKYKGKMLFTLIELIVVIVILGILAAIVIPNVADMKKESITSQLYSDVYNVQTAVDHYVLKKGHYPTALTPTLGEPEPIIWEELYPTYIKNLPTDKYTDPYYWIDYTGKVWGATVDSPQDIVLGESKTEWKKDKKVERYYLYQLSQVTSAAKKQSLKEVGFVESREDIDRLRVEGKGYLISAEDEYGLMTPPVGIDYAGYKEDWFTPILGKEGTFTFEMSSGDTMYWDGFHTVEDKPEGAKIEYSFSIQREDGTFTEYVQDFYSLAPSKSIKVQVKTTAYNGKYPSLYDMRIFYHFDEEALPVHHAEKVNVSEAGQSIAPNNPITVKDYFKLPSDKKVSGVHNSDTYSYTYNPNIRYSYSPDNVNYQNVDFFTQIPSGSYVRVEREYNGGAGYQYRPAVVQVSNSVRVSEEIIKTSSSNEEQWETIQTIQVFANATDGIKTKWIEAQILDNEPENTRIVYEYSALTGGTWTTPLEDLTSLPESISVRVRAILQVDSKRWDKQNPPTVTSIKLLHEKGAADLSLVQPTLSIVPNKNNNQTNEYFSTLTKVEWGYEASDPRGKEIVAVEWAGDRREQYPVGTYTIQARVKNESNYWSEWVTYKFTVKEELPIAVLEVDKNHIEVDMPIQWYSQNSYDPDGDGIEKVEWSGDYKSSYSSAGIYTVKLRVQDKEGNWSAWAEKQFTVHEKTYLLYRLEGENLCDVCKTYEHAEASKGRYVTGRDYTGGTETYIFKFTGNKITFRYLENGQQLYINVAGKATKINPPNTGLWKEYTESGLANDIHTVYVFDGTYALDYVEVYGVDLNPTIQVLEVTKVDELGNRHLKPISTFSNNKKESILLNYRIDKNYSETVKVSNSIGNIVRTIHKDKLMDGGEGYNEYNVFWDGRDNNRNNVPDGDYKIIIEKKVADGNTYKDEIPVKVDNRTNFMRYEAETDGSCQYCNRVVNLDASGGKIIEGRSGTSSYRTIGFTFTGNRVDIRYLNNGKELYVNFGSNTVRTLTNNSGTFSTLTIDNLPNQQHSFSIFSSSNSLAVIDYFDVYRE